MPVSGTIARLSGGGPIPFSMTDYGRVHVAGKYVYRSVFHIEGEPFVSDCPVSHDGEITEQDRLQHDKMVLAALGYDLDQIRTKEPKATH